MIKICNKSLLKPLVLLFENSTKSPCYPDIWKRSGRSHRVILDGQTSSWILALTGVSEGLKPLVLLFENPTKSSCYPDIWKDLMSFLRIRRMTSN